jgi:CDP-glucose 4,6-dehydratase
MKAVLLAGGAGSRISEETQLRPKPMIEIGGKPILWHIMKIYSAHGINDFVICLGYKGYVIKEYFANYLLHQSDVTFDMRQDRMDVHQKNVEPWRVTLVDTGKNAMTGGRLKAVRKYLGDEDFCMTYGDGVGDVDITRQIAFHREHQRLATITAVQAPGRFGSLQLDGTSVNDFVEKPLGDGAWINGGFFVLSPKVIDYIEDHRTIWEQEPLRRLAAERQLAAFKHEGFWQPMDTLRDKIYLEELWAKDEVPWRIWTEETKLSAFEPESQPAAKTGREFKVAGYAEKTRQEEPAVQTPAVAVAKVCSSDLNETFWRGKRVLVTGHTGFKGAWLCLMLKQLGAEVFGYALAPSASSLYELAGIDELVTSTEGDVRDLDQLKTTMRACAPQIVIHMAAQALVRPSYRDPVNTYATNVMGTVNVLESVRQVGGVHAVINVTSDKCYRNIETLRGYREDQPMGGYDPYSSSKGCAELISDAFRSSFFGAPTADGEVPALASVRAGNVIGGGDWAEDRLIPDAIRSCSKGISVEIRNPMAIRPWQWVLEPLGGYLLLAERLWTDGADYAGGWNFGPRDEDAKPVSAVIDQITKLWGDGASWRLTGSRHPHEAKYLKLDCTKAHTELGWAPRTNLDIALKSTVTWYKRVLQGADARTLSIEQICLFLGGEMEAAWTRSSAGFVKAA